MCSLLVFIYRLVLPKNRHPDGHSSEFRITHKLQGEMTDLMGQLRLKCQISVCQRLVTDENKHKQSHNNCSTWPFCCHLTNGNNVAQGISLWAAISSFKTQKPLWYLKSFELWKLIFTFYFPGCVVVKDLIISPWPQSTTIHSKMQQHFHGRQRTKCLLWALWHHSKRVDLNTRFKNLCRLVEPHRICLQKPEISNLSSYSF